MRRARRGMKLLSSYICGKTEKSTASNTVKNASELNQFYSHFPVKIDISVMFSIGRLPMTMTVMGYTHTGSKHIKGSKERLFYLL